MRLSLRAVYHILHLTLFASTYISGRLHVQSFDAFQAAFKNTTLQKMAIDEQTGNVYVGALNYLFMFDENLNSNTMRTTEVHFCNVRSYPCPWQARQNNSAKVLAIDKQRTLLLFCGSILNGLCSVYSLRNLSRIGDMDRNRKVNFVGGKSDVVAFFGAGPKVSPSLSVLYVAQSANGRRTVNSPFTVSSRYIKADKKPSNKYNIHYLSENSTLQLYSGIHVTSARSRYVYGFEHGGFTYYLSLQEKYRVQTRLVRVCQNDPGYYSYTEIELTCQNYYNKDKFYNIAQTAYLGPIGREFARRYKLDEDDEVLYVPFMTSYPFSFEVDRSKGVAVCLYPMSTIRRAFTDAQRDCYEGYGSILSSVSPGSPPCQRQPSVMTQLDDNFCGNEQNQGIQGRFPVQTTANWTSDHIKHNYSITALRVTLYKGKTILLAGTDNGKLLKILLNGNPDILPYVEIPVGRAPVAPDMMFDKSKQHIYVMSGSKISKIPLHTCAVYDNCATCVQAKDPLECGWCQDQCSTQDGCTKLSWTQDSCPPVIHSFSPLSGPVEGGTTLTIHGQDFGGSDHQNVTASVTIARVKCGITFRNMTLIKCLTGSLPDRMEKEDREVTVRIVDRSQNEEGYVIRGEASSGDTSFSYKKPEMKQLIPKIGPKSGGTTVTITGRNLDIGSSRRVEVMHLPCKPVRVISREQMECDTSPWEEPTGLFMNHRKRSLPRSRGPVKVIIDSAHLAAGEFEYAEDPNITAITPQSSILSGGLDITVRGVNLNVVQRAHMVVTVAALNQSFQETCQVSNEEGTELRCKSPNASLAKDLLNNKLMTNIHFLMDGVTKFLNLSHTHSDLSTFTYYEDPEVFSRERLLSSEGKVTIEIEGARLTLGLTQENTKTNFRISVGVLPCTVTDVLPSQLTCQLDSATPVSSMGSLSKVKVRVGNLEFDAGYVRFTTHQIWSWMVMIITILTSVVLLALILTIMVWMRRNRRGPFRKKLRTDGDVRYSRVQFSQPHHRQTSQRDSMYRMPTNPYLANGGRRAFIPVAVPVMHPVEPMLDEESKHLIEDSKLLIDRDCLVLGEIIGQGHFGCVYKGFVVQPGQKVEQEVAVKTLKSFTEMQHHSRQDGKKFIKEALMMREFDHPNILRLIGISLDKDDLPLVVLPYMKHGDLLSYIRDEKHSPTVKELIEFGIQIAEGMAYLANLKFVHRDLAARNCMLDDQMRVKVADFGLSRDIYERDYYSSDDRKAKLPVKWMAPESLEKGIYNTKTDGWSYGVVLWELITRGVCPYPEVDNWDIIKYLKSGRRMPQPSFCPDSLYDIMLQCWSPDPKDRPTFEHLVAAVKKVITLEEGEQEVSIDVTYANVPTTQSYLYPVESDTYPSRTLYMGSSGTRV